MNKATTPRDGGFTYKDHPQYSRVYRGGVHIGDIMCSISGMWFYQPKKGTRADAGPYKKNRNEVKAMIESA